GTLSEKGLEGNGDRCHRAPCGGSGARRRGDEERLQKLLAAPSAACSVLVGLVGRLGLPAVRLVVVRPAGAGNGVAVRVGVPRRNGDVRLAPCRPVAGGVGRRALGRSRRRSGLVARRRRSRSGLVARRRRSRSRSGRRCGLSRRRRHRHRHRHRGRSRGVVVVLGGDVLRLGTGTLGDRGRIRCGLGFHAVGTVVAAATAVPVVVVVVVAAAVVMAVVAVAVVPVPVVAAVGVVAVVVVVVVVGVAAAVVAAAAVVVAVVVTVVEVPVTVVVDPVVVVVDPVVAVVEIAVA